MNNKLKDNIKVNSTQWQELNIQNLVDKHFWPMQTIQLSSWICSKCWQQLNDFHKFYIQIEDAHMHFDSIMKIEIPNEREIAIQDTEKHITIVEEQKIIKQENVEDLYEDNIPLLQLKKQVADPLNTPKKLGLSKSMNSIKKESQKNLEILKDMDITDEHLILLDKLKYSPCPLKIGDNFDADSNNESYIKTSPTNESGTETSTTNKNMERDKFIAENFKLICDICQIPMETFLCLCNHFQKEHFQPGYASCCGKKFFKRRFLLEHIHLHLDPHYYKCIDCGKIMGDLLSLKNHSRIHSEKNYCCDICGNRFLTRFSLDCHKTRHLSEEEKLFSCSECGKKYDHSFGNKWTLKGHVKSMHTSTKKCDICGFILVNKSALTKHKSLKHPVGEQREYKCPICSKITANQHGLNTHIKYAHQMDYNHKCTVCNKSFKRPRSLRQHILTHSDTPFYSCPWCPKTFKTDSNISKHHTKWHPEEYQEEKRKKYLGNSNVIIKLVSKNIANDHSNSLNS